MAKSEQKCEKRMVAERWRQPSGANANGMEFEGIVGVFVECKEVVGMEEGSGGFGDGASVAEGNGINEGGEVGTVGIAVMGSVLGGVVGGKGSEEVDGVGKGAGGGAAMRAGEGA